MKLSILILTLLAGITLVTSSASAKAQDRKFESRGQTEEGYPRIEVGKGLDVSTVVRAFSAMYANSTKSVNKPDGEELTWRIIHAANPDKTIAVCMVPHDGPMFLRTKGDTSVWNSCEKGQQNIALVAMSIIVVPLKAVETIQQKVDRVDEQDGCMKSVACLQQRLTVLGAVPVLPPSPSVKKVEPPVEKPKALDVLFGEGPSVELVNLQAENQKLREQVSGLRGKPDWWAVWAVFALFCGVSVLYGIQLKRNRVLQSYNFSLAKNCRDYSVQIAGFSGERYSLEEAKRGLGDRVEELERELTAKNEDAVSLAKTVARDSEPVRELPPPRLPPKKVANERPQLTSNVSVLKSVPRPATKSTKSQTQKTRPMGKELPRTRLEEVEEDLAKAKGLAEAERGRTESLRITNDKLREELRVSRIDCADAGQRAEQSSKTVLALNAKNLLLATAARLEEEGSTPPEAMLSMALQFVDRALNSRKKRVFTLSLPVHRRLWDFLQVQTDPDADLIGEFRDQDRQRLKGQQPLLNFLVELAGNDRDISASA